MPHLQIVFETIVTVKDRSITQAEQLESTARHKTDLFLKENLGKLVDSLAVAPAANLRHYKFHYPA
jgi:hypothetical protein